MFVFSAASAAGASSDVAESADVDSVPVPDCPHAASESVITPASKVAIIFLNFIFFPPNSEIRFMMFLIIERKRATKNHTFFI